MHESSSSSRADLSPKREPAASIWPCQSGGARLPLVPTATAAAVDDAMSEADTPELEVRIRAQAYQLCKNAGRPEGQSDYSWYRAEDLIRLKELNQKAATGFVVLLGVVFSAAFLCIDHISEIAATATGRSDALSGLEKLAGLTGEAIINLDSKVRTLGDDPMAERDRRKHQVLDVLRSLYLDQQSLNQVANGERERDLIDRTAANGVLPHAAQAQAEQSEWNAEWAKQTTLSGC
jgi:Protein of unknown function (DUF2934)